MKWMVRAGLSTTVVEAGSEEAARAEAIDKLGVTHKPYLARDWRITLASQDELDTYAAFVDGLPKSEPTATSALRPKKKLRGTLFE